MSIKLILLKSGETLIADAKELVVENEETQEKEIHGYLFHKPNIVGIYEKESDKSLLTEENKTSGQEFQIILSSWILLTNDEDITIPKDWVVTIVEPVDTVKEMYLEKVNEQSS